MATQHPTSSQSEPDTGSRGPTRGLRVRRRAQAAPDAAEPQPARAATPAEKRDARLSASDGAPAADALADGRPDIGSHSSRANAKRPHRTNPLTRLVNQWCARLLGALADRSLSDQEAEYASGRTTRDFVCNTVGMASFGMVFPLLTIVVTQLAGVTQAGMFSLAYVAASLLLIVGNFGIRPFQVSDINEEHTFADYRVHRFITCAVMIVAGLCYCWLRGYTDQMLVVSMGIYLYKMIDALADVYEGRLQQVDKLYLAGISQAIRSLLVLAVFSLVLLLSGNLAASCVAMPITAALTFLVVTLPLSLFETPKSKRVSMRNVGDLFKQCAPLFLALFLYTFIDYMPVFVMESVLSYDNQLYYNAMYFPAQLIALIMSMVYKPLLLRLANIWADRAKRRRFDLITLGIVALIAAFTGIVVLLMGWIGIPLMSFMYGLDFEEFRGLIYIFLVAGGVTAVIDFMYQIIAVLRRQSSIMQLYLIAFGFSLFVPTLLVNFTGLPGAVIGYLIVMCILLVLMISEYLRIRMGMAKEEKAERAAREAADPAPHRRPSELRAERERREAVHAKWEDRDR